MSDGMVNDAYGEYKWQVAFSILYVREGSGRSNEVRTMCLAQP